MDLIRSPEPRSNRLALHQPGGLIEFIEIDQIQYIEADTVMTPVYDVRWSANASHPQHWSIHEVASTA